MINRYQQYVMDLYMQTNCAPQHNRQLNRVEQTLYYVLEDVLLQQSCQGKSQVKQQSVIQNRDINRRLRVELNILEHTTEPV